MKNEIINWLRFDKSYETAARLYKNYGLNQSFKHVLNRQGKTKHIEDLLLVELAKLAELPLTQAQAMYKAPKMIETKIELPKGDNAPGFNFVELPEMVRKTIRLREEFPFLKDKDCPDVLKVLVSDMLTAYDAYRESHETLFTAENEDELAKKAIETVENYLENRQIWDELEHYKINGQLLGKHPIFEGMELIEKLKGMSGAELAKRKETLKNGINRDKNKIAKNPGDEKIGEWTGLLQGKEKELIVVEELLKNK